jgi:putative ABC transport system ATP-binding protein
MEVNGTSGKYGGDSQGSRYPLTGDKPVRSTSRAAASSRESQHDAVIEATEVFYSYDDSEVVGGVTVTVADGESVALVGPSGSGKSTLLYCLAGILTPSRGEVLVDGMPTSDLAERERTALRARHFGFVLQFGRLVGELTAAENVSIPPRLLGMRRTAAQESALAMLDALDIQHLADRKAASLSGGEQQRVAVARALVHRPRVVFADEPTGALDSANAAQVMDLLTHACANGGASLLVVTHDQTVASGMSRTIRMRDGVLVDVAAA